LRLFICFSSYTGLQLDAQCHPIRKLSGVIVTQKNQVAEVVSVIASTVNGEQKAVSNADLAYEGSRNDGPFLNPARYRRDNVTGNYTWKSDGS
jgi:hypothetical protein